MNDGDIVGMGYMKWMKEEWGDSCLVVPWTMSPLFPSKTCKNHRIFIVGKFEVPAIIFVPFFLQDNLVASKKVFILVIFLGHLKISVHWKVFYFSFFPFYFFKTLLGCLKEVFNPGVGLRWLIDVFIQELYIYIGMLWTRSYETPNHIQFFADWINKFLLRQRYSL